MAVSDNMVGVLIAYIIAAEIRKRNHFAGNLIIVGVGAAAWYLEYIDNGLGAVLTTLAVGLTITQGLHDIFKKR